MKCEHKFNQTEDGVTCEKCGVSLTSEQWGIFLGQLSGDSGAVKEMLYPSTKPRKIKSDDLNA